MKTFFTLLLSCFVFLTFGQNVKPVDLVQEQQNKNTTFKAISAFSTDATKKAAVNELDASQIDFDVLNIDQTALQQLRSKAPEAIELTIPFETKNTNLELQLVQVDIFAPDFQVTRASDGQAVDMNHGIFYRGIIKNDLHSVVAISVFENEIRGLIANDEGNFVLGKLDGSGWSGEHIIYNDKEILADMTLDCGMTDDEPFKGYSEQMLTYDEEKAPGDCIRLYMEVDNDIHNQKGGVTPATNYVTGLMNEVITLYANESITAVVSEIFVWNVTSPYSSTSSSGMLSDFQAATGAFNGDLAQLLSYQASGGIAAGFAGICNSNPDNSKAFSNIQSTYSQVPTYSWSVMVTTHEFGHLWGSRHTHACVWNGNNTAIDGCAGQTEGSCSLPGFPSQGGTIMSYCHLQSVGINFNEGFGPQPGNVIRNSVNNATCTSACGPATCTDGIQNGDETGVDCGGSSCPACPPCDDVTLTIVLDNYPGETSWTITSGGTTYGSGGGYSGAGSTVVETVCLTTGCYDFTIFDSYGDGICCGYGNGSYVLEDAGGNVLASGGAFGSSETTNFCVTVGGGGDTQAPSNPTNLSASNTTQTTTDLSWNASSDNVGVTGYNVYMNGSLLGSVAGTGANVTGLTPSTTYSFYVTAYDAAGNQSGNSNTVNVTTLSSGGGGCTSGVLSSNSFETGWEGWSDGGSDCSRYSGTRSWDGSYSIQIRDNSGTASSTTSSSYDLSEFSSVDIEFYFYAYSMENGEDFWVRFNNGSGWSTIATYAAGSSFNNNSFYVATVTVPGTSLSSNCQFRFQCDASANADQIYIDLVTVTGNCSALPGLHDGPVSTIEELKTPAFVDIDFTNDYAELDAGTIHLYPNPAQDELNLTIPADMVVQSLTIYSIDGKQLRHIQTENNFQTLNISDLNAGLYLISIETSEEVINKKFIKR